MAECIDAIAVDVGDRAGGAHVHVAAGERHADGVAFAQRARRGQRLFAPAKADGDRREPGVAERPGDEIDRGRVETAEQ